MRLHLFEFEDLTWFPDHIRQGGTDYLRYFLNFTSFYRITADIIAPLLLSSGKEQIVDLCSGGGGNIEMVHNALKEKNVNVQILLTDKFPNHGAFALLSTGSNGEIGFIKEPVDALNVPHALAGLRTIFSAIHHFKPQQVTVLLADAAKRRAPIAIFDGGNKNLFMIIGILVVQPVTFLIWTPFFRPFSWRRLVFTYVIPLIPLMTMWDGIVSILRLYTPEELLRLAHATGHHDYKWQTGKVKNRLGFSITYLTGYYKP